MEREEGGSVKAKLVPTYLLLDSRAFIVVILEPNFALGRLFKEVFSNADLDRCFLGCGKRQGLILMKGPKVTLLRGYFCPTHGTITMVSRFRCSRECSSMEGSDGGSGGGG